MIKLMRNNVALTPIFEPDESPGGIIIPDQAKSRCVQGIVKYLGPKAQWLKPGDYCIFGAYNGTLTRIDDELIIIMPENFVNAVILEVPNVEIPGLFFRSKQDYFPATYETAVNLIAAAFKKHNVVKVRDKTQTRIDPSDYELAEEDDNIE